MPVARRRRPKRRIHRMFSAAPKPKRKEIIVRMIAVFGVNQSQGEEPRGYMPREDASELVDDGFARSINRGKAIQLIERKPLKLRDLSCQMGHKFIEEFAAGSQRARAILAEWMP